MCALFCRIGHGARAGTRSRGLSGAVRGRLVWFGADLTDALHTSHRRGPLLQGSSSTSHPSPPYSHHLSSIRDTSSSCSLASSRATSSSGVASMQTAPRSRTKLPRGRVQPLLSGGRPRTYSSPARRMSSQETTHRPIRLRSATRSWSRSRQCRA